MMHWKAAKKNIYLSVPYDEKDMYQNEFHSKMNTNESENEF